MGNFTKGRMRWQRLRNALACGGDSKVNSHGVPWNPPAWDFGDSRRWNERNQLMQATLGELAVLVGGQVVGPEGLAIHGAVPLRDALPGQITMIDSADRARDLAGSKASAVLCPRSFLPDGTPALLVDNVHEAFSKIIVHFHPRRAAKRIGVSPLAAISPTAVLGADVDVHPFATIGDDVTIGGGSTIHAGGMSWPDRRSARM